MLGSLYLSRVIAVLVLWSTRPCNDCGGGNFRGKAEVFRINFHGFNVCDSHPVLGTVLCR